MLYRLGRELLISRYPAGYRQRRPRERSEVEEWILPVAPTGFPHYKRTLERFQIRLSITSTLRNPYSHGDRSP